jgi:hypothetical protein
MVAFLVLFSFWQDFLLYFMFSFAWRIMRTIFFTPIPPLSFEPYCISYDSLSPSLPFRVVPICFPDYIVQIGQGRVIVLVDLPSPELDKPFLDFCELIAVGHGADNNSPEIRH